MKCAFQFFASQQGKAIPLFAVNFLEIYVSSSDSLSFKHPLKPFKTHFFVLILVLDFFDFLELPSTKKKKKNQNQKWLAMKNKLHVMSSLFLNQTLLF